MRANANEASPGEDRRQHPRHDVSLIARVDVAGRSYPAVVTCLAAEGAFVQFDGFAPVGTALRLDVGLGEERGRLSVVGEVAHRDKRFGAATVRGVGMSFRDPPDDLDRLIDELAEEAPEPLRLDALGRITWPLMSAVRRVPDGGELAASVSGRWISAEAPPPSETGLALDEAYANALDRLLREAEGLASAPVRVFYRGRPLAPQEGLPLEQANRSPAVESLVVQMAAIDALHSCEWHLDRTDDRSTQWKLARGWTREARKLLKHSDCAEPWVPELRGALRKIEPMLVSVLWAIAANRAEEEIGAAESRHEPAPSTVHAPAVPAAPAARRSPHAEPPDLDLATASRTAPPAPRPASRRPPRLSCAPKRQESVSPWWALVASLVAVAALVVGLIWSSDSLGRVGAARPPVTPTDLRTAVPALSVEGEAGRLAVTVPVAWTEREVAARHDGLVRAARIAAHRGYDQLIARTPDGRAVALWQGATGLHRLLG